MEKKKKEMVTTLNYKKYNVLNDWKDVRMNNGEDVQINDGIIVGIIEGTWLMKVMLYGIHRTNTSNLRNVGNKK